MSQRYAPGELDEFARAFARHVAQAEGVRSVLPTPPGRGFSVPPSRSRWMVIAARCGPMPVVAVDCGAWEGPGHAVEVSAARLGGVVGSADGLDGAIEDALLSVAAGEGAGPALLQARPAGGVVGVSLCYRGRRMEILRRM